MAKDPAFLFYPNDYIGGTMGLTFEEKGAYIELLMVQFNRGHMTSHMIEQVLGHKFGQIFGRIEDKFVVDSDGLYYNKRLDEEKEKRQKFTNSRRNNKLGTNQHTKKEENILGHMTSHMENENVNKLSSIVKENFEKFLQSQNKKLSDNQIELLAERLNSFPNDKYRIKSIKKSIIAGYPDFYEIKDEESNGIIRRGKKYNEDKTKVLMEDGEWEDLTNSEKIIAQADEYHLASQIFRK